MFGKNNASDQPFGSFGTDFQSAIDFVKQVKVKTTPETYARFLAILHDYQSNRPEIMAVVTQVAELFQGVPDLRAGFVRFLPPNPPAEALKLLGAEAETPVSAEPASANDDWSKFGSNPIGGSPSKAPSFGELGAWPTFNHDSKGAFGGSSSPFGGSPSKAPAFGSPPTVAAAGADAWKSPTPGKEPNSLQLNLQAAVAGLNDALAEAPKPCPQKKALDVLAKLSAVRKVLHLIEQGILRDFPEVTASKSYVAGELMFGGVPVPDREIEAGPPAKGTLGPLAGGASFGFGSPKTTKKKKKERKQAEPSSASDDDGSGSGSESGSDDSGSASEESAPVVARKKMARKVRDRDAPKRPASAYMIFAQKERDSTKERLGPDVKFMDVAKALAESWKSLSDEDKRPYQSQAQKDKEAYEVAVVEYNASKSSK